MPAVITDNQPVVPAPSEQAALDALRQLLACDETCELKLVGPDGTAVDVPPSAVHALRQVVAALAQQRVVLVEDLPMDLTIEDAADLLGLRFEDVDRLVEQGQLPSKLVHNRRRIPFEALMAYRAEYKAERRAALDELTQLSQELGLYELDDETA